MQTRTKPATLLLTAVIIASGILAAFATTACRGGGANPGESDLVIPFVEPTLSKRTCLDEVYPPTAPRFEEVSDSDFQPGSNGVDYAILQTGEGESPGIDWQVEVHYTGWLEDGCVFGTTYSNDRSAKFFLAYVIPGWRQSLMDMKIGERRRVRIPSDQGYGEAGSPPRIPANATLYFDVELLGGITGQQAMTTATAVNEAAILTVTAISEEVRATFTAIAEESTPESEASEP